MYIFHKDSKIRRLCLILSESQDSLDALHEFEKDGNEDYESVSEEDYG